MGVTLAEVRQDDPFCSHALPYGQGLLHRAMSLVERFLFKGGEGGAHIVHVVVVRPLTTCPLDRAEQCSHNRRPIVPYYVAKGGGGGGSVVVWHRLLCSGCGVSYWRLITIGNGLGPRIRVSPSFREWNMGG